MWGNYDASGGNFSPTPTASEADFMPDEAPFEADSGGSGGKIPYISSIGVVNKKEGEECVEESMGKIPPLPTLPPLPIFPVDAQGRIILPGNEGYSDNPRVPCDVCDLTPVG
jgi:hypothetical protein